MTRRSTDLGLLSYERWRHLLASCVDGEARTYCGIQAPRRVLVFTIIDRRTDCPDCLLVMRHPSQADALSLFCAPRAERVA
jgi:hypothetical protein